MLMDELDQILLKRAVPEVPHDLSGRIIRQARAHQLSPRPFRSLFLEIMDFIVLPRPAYAMAFSLCVAMIVGFEAAGGLAFAQQDWSSFLMIDEGEWL